MQEVRSPAWGLNVLLWPWLGLFVGLVALSLAQAWTAQASATECWQMLAGDVLLLPRAVLVWCLLTLSLIHI